ncbi:MAG: hypothetical protein LBU09_00135 [Endomicrobium sp.]|jgi:hypothetical protein|nr:hypothetical protein [Endomicrobium sp.]
MAIVFNPRKIVNKVLPKAGEDLLTGNLRFKDKFKQSLLRLDYITNKDLKHTIDGSLKFYKGKISELKGEGVKNYKAEALNGGKLLNARLSDLVVEKASADIKEKYAGKKYVWLPSDAEEQDMVHALNYGKTFTVGEGEQPGERYGCRCAMEILDVDGKDTPDIYKSKPQAKALPQAKELPREEKILTKDRLFDEKHIANTKPELKEAFKKDGTLKDYESYKSPQEAKTHLSKMLDLNFDSLNELQTKYFYNAVKETTGVFKMLLNVSEGKTIKLNEYVKSFDAKGKRGSRRSLAYANSITGEIGMKNVNAWQRESERGVLGGHFPKNTNVNAILIHEVGHLLSLKSTSSIEYYKKVETLKEIRDKLFEKYKKEFKTIEEMQESISKYAGTNVKEFFAESFADYIQNGKKANKIAFEFVESWRRETKI